MKTRVDDEERKQRQVPSRAHSAKRGSSAAAAESNGPFHSESTLPLWRIVREKEFFNVVSMNDAPKMFYHYNMNNNVNYNRQMTHQSPANNQNPYHAPNPQNSYHPPTGLNQPP